MRPPAATRPAWTAHDGPPRVSGFPPRLTGSSNAKAAFANYCFSAAFVVLAFGEGSWSGAEHGCHRVDRQYRALARGFGRLVCQSRGGWARPLCLYAADTGLDCGPLVFRIVYNVSRGCQLGRISDRKSTRLNSSHTVSSYAVFCLKKKKSGLSSKTYRQTTT